MKKAVLFLVIFMFPACRENASQPPQPASSPVSSIEAFVQWQNQGIAGVRIVLVQLSDTLSTDSSGHAHFNVPAGSYTVRALGLQGPGPAPRTADTLVSVQTAQTVRVQFTDCIVCM